MWSSPRHREDVSHRSPQTPCCHRPLLHPASIPAWYHRPLLFSPPPPPMLLWRLRRVKDELQIQWASGELHHKLQLLSGGGGGTHRRRDTQTDSMAFPSSSAPVFTSTNYTDQILRDEIICPGGVSCFEFSGRRAAFMNLWKHNRLLPSICVARNHNIHYLKFFLLLIRSEH